MQHSLPTDAKLKDFIDQTIQASPDVSLLTRTVIKNDLAEEFKLSVEQRQVLDSDPEYKSKIKGWIQEAIDNLPSGSGSDSGSDNEGTRTEERAKDKLVVKGKDEVESKIEAEAEAEAMSEFSSLEDDDDDRPKKKKKMTKKARQEKGDNDVSGDGAVLKSKTTAKQGSRKDGEKGETEKLEMRLKKLKSLVIQCGTRKLWKRTFEEAGCGDGDEDTNDPKKLKKQISIVESTLQELGMETPFSQAKAIAIKEEKEMKEDLEAIKQANTTERSATRGGRKRRESGPTREASATSLSEEDEMQPAPHVRKFNRSLADFAAELNDD